MRLLTLVFACVVGCAPAPPSISRPPLVYDVSWLALVRDRATAESYVGHTVRVRLAPGDYSHESGELRVWAGRRDRPPIIVIRLAAPLPAGAGAVVVVGTVRAVTADGQWRSPRADFAVHITGATASPP